MFQSFILGAVAALAVPALSALPTISTKGNKFFDSNGAQWFIKGVAYQLTDKDPLLDTAQCQLDASLMKELGANAIRVYHVQPNGDHSGCMQAFDDAGIYLLVDLDDFPTAINQTQPAWTEGQERAYEAVMDEFQNYNNTAAFFIANESLTDGNHTEVAVLVKAATRDMKAYRDSKGYRAIPIGYSHADIDSLRPNLQNYLACGPDTADSIDFFGLNSYQWCGSHVYNETGYVALNEQAQGYPVPIFFSETGCNKPEPRLFQDQNAILGPDMDQLWSGAIIYEWIQESNHFGLITYGGSTDALDLTSVLPADVVRSGTPTPVTPDFANLSNVWKTVAPSSISEAEYSPSLTAPPCPAFTSGVWEVNGDVSLPPVGATIDAAASQSINQGDGGSAPTSSAAADGPSNTGGAASANKEVAGMAVGLAGVMLGFSLL